MDIRDILNKVKSPFTDEELEKLIRLYIECNCDMDEFYRKVQLNTEKIKNPYADELYGRLSPFFNKTDRFVENNGSWDIVASSRETLSVPYESEDRIPIYRIYINAKGQEKAKIVEEYIKKCEETGQSYKLKYSIKDGRKDEIIILSYGEDLVRNIELVEKITEGIDLGEPAKLVGRYKDKIGIGEEYIQAPIYSYTQTRLGIIPIIMQKYFLDHKAHFEPYLDDNNKGLGEGLLKNFKKRSERLEKKIAVLPEDAQQAKQELENKKNAYENNITLDFTDMYDSICCYIPKTMEAYMAEHSETAISEIIESYRLACETFGISRNGVFSKVTEEIIEHQKQTPLQQRETKLSTLEAEAIRDTAELKEFESKEGQNIGE